MTRNKWSKSNSSVWSIRLPCAIYPIRRKNESVLKALAIFAIKQQKQTAGNDGDSSILTVFQKAIADTIKSKESYALAVRRIDRSIVAMIFGFLVSESHWTDVVGRSGKKSKNDFRWITSTNRVPVNRRKATATDSSRKCAAWSRRCSKRCRRCSSIRKPSVNCWNWSSIEFPMVSRMIFFLTGRSERAVHVEPEQPALYYENINQLLKVSVRQRSSLLFDRECLRFLFNIRLCSIRPNRWNSFVTFWNNAS